MWLNPVRARKFIHGSTSRSRTQQRGRVGSPVWFVAIFVNTVEKPVLCMLTQPYSRGNTVVRYVRTVRSIRRSCSIGPAKVDRDLHPWNIIPLCPFFPPILRPAGGAYVRLPTPHWHALDTRTLLRPRFASAKKLHCEMHPSTLLSPESFSRRPPVNCRSMDNEAKCTTSAGSEINFANRFCRGG